MKKPGKKIRVAMVAPPFGAIGGPEIVVQNLSYALSKKNVRVTLFAPADWKIKSKKIRHVPTLLQSLWNMADFKNQTPRVRRNLIISSQIQVLFDSKRFDLIHLHSSTYAFLVGKFSKAPCLLSFHNKITLPEYRQIREAGIIPVSLSKWQKGSLKTAATIWNGVPVKEKSYSLRRGAYLITVGRLADQKGIDTSIQIARKAKKKLLIFGRIGNSEKRQSYYQKKIKPYLGKEKIIYMGEVSNEEIYSYLKEAEALLFPIRRSEVCPMIIAESLTCGTPIIGTKINPLTELLEKDKNICFLSNNIKELVAAAKNTNAFNRKACRGYAEKNFSSDVMADKYIRLYNKIVKG